jgi:hypothetical protein
MKACGRGPAAGAFTESHVSKASGFDDKREIMEGLLNGQAEEKYGMRTCSLASRRKTRCRGKAKTKSASANEAAESLR